jgi:molecular chaperone DnaK
MNDQRTIGIGIDLGTSNCSISLVNIGSGRPDFSEAADLTGARLIPSVVYVGDDLRLEFGEAVLSRTLTATDAARVVTDLKLLLRSNEPMIFDGLDTPVYPVDLIRGLLSYLKLAFETSFRIECDHVVITRPAYEEFDVDYRERVREAVLGGATPIFKSFATLEEPDAVLRALGDLQNMVGKKVMVFDMGGGTLDISIRSIEECDGRIILRQLAVKGSDVAGRKLTRLIANKLFDQIAEGSLTGETREEFFRLNFSNIDTQKRNFSSLITQSIVTGRPVKHHTFHLLTKMPGQTVRARLILEDFNEILATFVGEAMATVQTALGSASLLPEEIDYYFVVGGGSRIPMLSTELEKLFGKPSEALVGEFGTIDINYAVGRGAAVYDLDRSQDIEDQAMPTIIERLLPYSISMKTDAGQRSICLFEEGCVLPAESSHELRAVVGNRDVRVELVRGLSVSGVPLKTARVTLPDVPNMSAQDLTFVCNLSTDGELTITVSDWKGRLLPALRFDELI